MKKFTLTLLLVVLLVFSSCTNNGDPFWAATVDAGMKANEEISFSDKEFEKNNIEAVEKIQLTLRAYDNDDWTADDIVNETLTITP